MGGSAGRSWRHGRVEQPRAAAPNRPGAQPGLLPRHAGAGHLPRIRQRTRAGLRLLPGWRVPGAVGPRRRAASPGHGVMAAGARAGRGAAGARRAWRADPAGAQAGAVGAAGDVDRGPGWGAHLHRGGAGGASAAPPRLIRTSVICMSCRRASPQRRRRGGDGSRPAGRPGEARGPGTGSAASGHCDRPVQRPAAVVIAKLGDRQAFPLGPTSSRQGARRSMIVTAEPRTTVSRPRGWRWRWRGLGKGATGDWSASCPVGPYRLVVRTWTWGTGYAAGAGGGWGCALDRP